MVNEKPLGSRHCSDRAISSVSPTGPGSEVQVAVARQLSARALGALTREASFVFQGRVDSIGKHNLDEGVEVDERMAIIRVEDVVVAPPTLGDLAGRHVTVLLESTSGIEPKQSLTFFATSWHYGTNIGVVEIG